MSFTSEEKRVPRNTTKNHKVLTKNRGWVQVKNLTDTDILVCKK